MIKFIFLLILFSNIYSEVIKLTQEDSFNDAIN